MVGNLTDADALLARFIQVVKTPVMTTPSVWHSSSFPQSGVEIMTGHRILGAQSEPNPTWQDMTGEFTATNVFYMLHIFAVRLTRHRQARGILQLTSSTFLDLGLQLTSHVEKNTVWFDLPDIGEPGEIITSSAIENFLINLRNQVTSIRNDAIWASDMFGSTCHSSCHSSCHGARGRR